MKIKIGISNRHVHLKREDVDILFGKGFEFTKRNDLSQHGEFATNEVVEIRTDKYSFPHVRVVGPIRNYTQVEIAPSDAKLLGLNPPMRDSGDVSDSEDIEIIGPKGKVLSKSSCIIPNRHIHRNKYSNFAYNNGDIIKGNVKGKIMDNIHVKEKDTYELELHLTIDDAALYNVENGDYIDIE